MNWAQYKDPVSNMCLAGNVVACWFVGQDVIGLNTHFLQKYFSSYTDSVYILQNSFRKNSNERHLMFKCSHYMQ